MLRPRPKPQEAKAVMPKAAKAGAVQHAKAGVVQPAKAGTPAKAGAIVKSLLGKVVSANAAKAGVVPSANAAKAGVVPGSIGKVLPGNKFAVAAQKPAAASAQSAEEMKRRQEELKERREEMEAKRAQQKAAFTVRKVMERMRTGDPEKFAEMVAELENAQNDNLEAMGDLAETVQEEAEKAIKVAEERYKAHEEKKVQEEIEQQEKELKAKEDAERLETLVTEATVEVEDAETKATEAVEASAVLKVSDKEADPSGILGACKAIEEAMEAYKEASDLATKSLKEKRGEVVKAKGVKDAAKFSTKLADLQRQLAASAKQLEPLGETMKSAREKAQRKASAVKKEENRKNAFTKHDTDGDGKLNKSEIVAFAKSEYSFDLDDAIVANSTTVANISKISIEGVSFEKFPKLRALISTAKALARARRNREREAQLEKEREGKKSDVMAAVEAVKAELAKADEAMKKTQAAAKKLAPSNAESSLDALSEALSEVDVETVASKALLDAAEELNKTVPAEDDEDEVIKAFRKTHIDKEQERIKAYRSQLSKVGVQVKDVRDSLARKSYAAMEKLRPQVVTSVLAVMKAEEKTGVDVFNAAAGEKTTLAEEEFIAFIKSLSGRAPEDSVPEALRPDTIDEKQYVKLFKHVACGQDAVDEEQFVLSMTQLHYKIAKTTVLSEEQGLSSKSSRKLELGEVVECLEGPVKVGELKRLRVKASQDDKEGWVTMMGNQGSVFLEPMSAYYICVKETALADEMAVSASKTVRKILKNEYVQMIEAERKDEACGVSRMKVRMVKDGKAGWVSTKGSQGVQFFEPC